LCGYEQSTFLNPSCLYRVIVWSEDYHSPLSWHWCATRVGTWLSQPS